MALSQVDLANSVFLAASWINVFLYTMELVLCRNYFRRSRPLINKIGVGVMVLSDTLCTVATCIEVQLSLVVFPNNPVSPEFVKPLAAVIYTTYITAVIEQFFMIKIYFLLTGNVLVTGFLTLAALNHLANWPLVSVGAISCAVTDVLIATCLCFKFWQLLNNTSPETATRSLVQRIMILTIGSGATVASNTLIMVILLLKLNPAFQLFFTCQGRVYALSLLGSFLIGTPFNPTSRADTNPGARVGTALVFHVANPDAGLENSSRPERGRNSPMVPSDNSSTYKPQYEERIDLKDIPSLSRKPSRV
ncbi:hypothetical protein B0H17DRAFT_1175473 [Mycena rosella]|uniref:DUF6534 domain-containing protein n=1 Tax=Mycena rosella TaxID=1033263 RepID=A0AAD7GTW6_MYCRO|nr:hypothetical protein B0H17DRAFT_1175473 [Mycena rosella]